MWVGSRRQTEVGCVVEALTEVRVMKTNNCGSTQSEKSVGVGIY